jgi:transaldolase/glucose-6-phosphate isomerase
VSLPVQSIIPGRLEPAYLREFQSLVDEQAVPRLWNKDPTLWPSEGRQAKSLKTNLGWLDLPAQMGPYMERVAKHAMDIESEGFEDVVFIAMGGSNLAAETILHLPGAKLGKRLSLLDSTDPGSIIAIEKKLNLERALFVFSNKSGKGIETHALLLYFLDRLKTAGVPAPGRHFVALTEENSYLADLARQYHFSGVFFDPPGISGRYSSLIHYGLFLAAVCHVDPRHLLVLMEAMRDACGPTAPARANPALSLGAFLAAGEMEGLDRLLLLSTASVERFMYRVGALVGASTGKGSHGIVPIFGQAANTQKMFEQACMVAMLTMADDDSTEVLRKSQELKLAGVPVATIELHGPEVLGIELFKWEIATALACSRIQVNPFDDPDVQHGRVNTAHILQQITTHREMPASAARVREAGLELHAEGEIRREISTLSMSEALRTFLELCDPEGYLALLPFLNLSPSMVAALLRVRDLLVSSLEIPVLVTSGPRYLHAIGQVYKGGPAKGLFLVLTANAVEDLEIPGAAYTFGQLELALALGDFRALVQQERPVLRLHLARGAEQGVAQLESVLTTSLVNRRRTAQ